MTFDPQIFLETWTSIDDWDFEQGNYRFLSDEKFISPPTSLKLYDPSIASSDTVLCRDPDTLCLPQGEVRTWHFCEVVTTFPSVFRNQSPLDTSTYDNGYYICVYAGTVRFGYYHDGVNHVLHEESYAVPYNQWNHWRTIWLNGVNGEGNPALCVSVYLEIEGEWEQIVPTFYDTQNRWKDSEINRCGFRHNIQAGKPAYIDDTEIWGPV